MTVPAEVIQLCYLVASVLFILGLKGLTHPRTAVRGNLFGATAMLVAVIAMLLSMKFDFTLIIAGLLIGTIIGIILAVKIQMTAMPQLVALFNGFGGGASVLVAGAYLLAEHDPTQLSVNALIATVLSGFIGGVTFSGSLIAFAKLQEIKAVKDVRFGGQQALNGVLVLLCLLFAVLLVQQPEHAVLYYWLTGLFSIMLGVFLVISIGGADMPVVIALLNSYSGLAAAATGFVFSNTALIIAGSLVGASGLILTNIMCVAMNRSLANVLFGKMQPSGGGSSTADEEIYANVKSTSPDEVAMLLDVCQRVVIIPGYGMAVAQAQHAVRDLTNLLKGKGIEVEFGIHPVAGRMPGHMNVLLAEADIPYELLKEMDQINPTMAQADMAIVLGANDVVNPQAREDAGSPIYGMPIIDVDKARTVVIIKRSLSPGFAGIPNPLFAADNSLMLFGDGKKALQELITAIQEG